VQGSKYDGRKSAAQLLRNKRLPTRRYLTSSAPPKSDSLALGEIDRRGERGWEPDGQPELKRGVVVSNVEVGMKVTIARNPVVVAVSLCAVLLCFWIVFVGSKNPPVDRRVSNLALSASGRWLAAGTAQGKITVWDQGRPDVTKQIEFPHGSLNDVDFSLDEHLLAVASEDLGIYAPAESATPRLLRSDHVNYGSVRFSLDSQNLLVTTGTGVIEAIDAHSGAVRLKVCCSSIGGDAVFTPDGQEIVNAGHWPRLWDARSGRLVAPLTADREIYALRSITFDASRDAILMGSQDGRVYAWDLKTKQRIAVSPPQPAYVDTIAVATNGWILFAGFGREMQLWNPDTGQRRSLPRARPTSNLVLGRDGTSIIFGTADGTIEYWDVGTEQRLRSVRIPGL
jgi:WD40 repeat protein